jgi:hypothetical protein
MKKILYYGNSHIVMMRLKENLSHKKLCEQSFLPVNLYELGKSKLHKLLEGEATEFQCNHNIPNIVNGVINVNDYDALVCVGMIGPGDVFRVIAQKSFTGGFSVPAPEVVNCPYVATIESSVMTSDYPPISTDILEIITEQYFRKKMTEIIFQTKCYRGHFFHVPSPQMSCATVKNRFGDVVVNSDTGLIINRVYSRILKCIAIDSDKQHLLNIPIESLTSKGWLKDEFRYTDSQSEIHANGDYGKYYLDKLHSTLF